MKQLSRKQLKFLRSVMRTVIYRGGIRSGKTFVLCLKAIEYSLSMRRFCVVSFSYPVLRDVCMYTMRKILSDYGYPYTENISDKTITPSKGVEILFRSGDSPDSLRGLSLDGFGIDEAREFGTREIYDIMIGRLSNSADAQGYITTSPKGRNWVNDLEGLPGVETIIQRTDENPFLPPEYIEALRQSYTSQFAAQELDADIVQFGAGIIKPEWLGIVHVPITGRTIRYWDLAVSVKTAADYSAGAKLVQGQSKFQIADIKRVKIEYPDLRELIINTAIADGCQCILAIEEAGQQRGFIDDIKREQRLHSHTIRAIPPHGDKLNRAMPWVSRAQLGALSLLSGHWNKQFIDECLSFTADDTHEHDDMIDAVSGAWRGLDVQIATARRILI